MQKFLFTLLCLGFVANAGSETLLYKNGLSLDFVYFVGEVDRNVVRSDISAGTANTTWQQYFTDDNLDTPPSTLRFGITYYRPFFNFLVVEAGIALIHTDEYSYSRYANYTAESFTENLNSLSLQLGLLLQHRISKVFNIFLSPSLELVNQFASYHYETTPPSSSTSIDERHISYRFRPSFTAKSGFEFVPGGKPFGISILVLYRNC